MTEVLPLKFTRKGGRGNPGVVWRPGEWHTVPEGPLYKPGVHSIHYCATLLQALTWLDVEAWLFEDGTPEETIGNGEDNNRLTRRGRVVELIPAWNETTARLFAADCAERALPIYEAVYPSDDRPRKAIAAARAFARGEIDDAARAAARTEAWDAAEFEDGAGIAAWAAARAAAATVAALATKGTWSASVGAASALATAPEWDVPVWEEARCVQALLLGEYLDGTRS